MTLCPMGCTDHPFSYVDPTGAYCEEHEFTVLWKPGPEPVPDEPAQMGRPS